MATSDAPVTTTVEGDVTVIRLDDGKANALTHDIIDALHSALDAAERDSAAAVLVGRPGRFSAGFDLAVMSAGADSALPLLKAGAELAMHIYMAKIPVVLGCTGHAVAMGAITLMAADARVGAEGAFKIGMNEVAIGMPVPRFAVELARDRLVAPQVVPAVQHAHLYDPESAVRTGFLDRIVPPEQVEAEALAHATLLGETLHRAAFRLTREVARGPVAQRLEQAIAADVATTRTS